MSDTVRKQVLQKHHILLEKMSRSLLRTMVIDDLHIECHPHVFSPHTNTLLLAKSARVTADDRVLEVGAGTGYIAILLARKCKSVAATDISPYAITNIRANARANNVMSKVRIKQCDLFPDEAFDVIVINPPYVDHAASTIEQKAIWDASHALIRRFFLHLPAHLTVHGRLYISWADYADFQFIEDLMAACGLVYTVIASQQKDDGILKREYRVYEAHF